MAKPLLKIETNFSFRKLAGQIKGFIGGAITDEAKGYIIESKKPIEGGTLRPLTASTLRKRRDGVSDYEGLGHIPVRTHDETPLHYTGDLLESMELTKKGVFGGVSINKYGLDHHSGTGEMSGLKPRPFLAKPGSSAMKPHEEKMIENFEKKIIKALMK